jgi:RNA polymerase sigma factor (sigma-70 family)
VIDLEERLDWFKDRILPHEAALRSRLRRMTASYVDLDDLVAEALARAYATDDWGRIANGKHYLFRIARNMLIDSARRDAVVSFDLVADIEQYEGHCSPDPMLSARDELRQVQRVIDGLPPQCRRVFVLRRVHELSPGEIAREMELSVSTVEKHLAKALMLIARGLAEIEEWGVERERTSAAGQSLDRRGSRARLCEA